ncbi:hypothetical protein [Microbulbifer thermotolerans]|uniref:Uncharacterized protein n=1 Tax=Microbulbifer thermotolerans TaxID=252514 RepID=A0A143HP87_MICTH|nr:hypothetical protein [Microbulbifer thermotolerans]AMX03529.1 hypothetical protein A3224_13950 [Microbulbifer thermotolerans]MCX2778152.1 hypothetical protein [Microbulbifer thermotolerans]MCX2795306.1 hypothetical protein [Microbulbifer thermotolerans]MCX2801132.1 hypothetical protein [Microbulbifer thermotolerans]MCX2804500.1 hypothetical protein [Microbulbifer thermotolerans]
MSPSLNKILRLSTTALLISTLSACGGSSNNDKQDNPTSPPVKTTDPKDPVETETGVFIDSPVVNIGYRTVDSDGNTTHEGVTNANGEYDYEPGDTVIFFIGSLEFPPAAAMGKVTPLDIAGTTDTSDNTVINMARLLQSLDTDGDPSNNITISDTAVGSKDPNLSTEEFFAQSPEDFATSSVVQSLIENGGQDQVVTELVSMEEAQAHLESTLEEEQLGYTNEYSLTGGWVLDTSDETGNGTNHFIFLAFDETNGTYLHVEEKEFPDETEEGLEWGFYSLGSDKVLKATEMISDQNGGIGLHDPEDGDFNQEDGEYITFEVDGNDATLSIFESAENGEEDQLAESIPTYRVVANGLQGVWVADTESSDALEEGDLVMIAFLENGTYVEAEDDGAEVGNYSYDAETGIVTISNIFVDTNEYGLSDFVGTADLKMFVNGNLMTFETSEEQVIFNRLGAGPAGISSGNDTDTDNSQTSNDDGILLHLIWGGDTEETYCEEIRWVEDNEVVMESDASGSWQTLVETINGSVSYYPEVDPSLISAGEGQCPQQYRTPYRCADDNFITYEENAAACTDVLGGELL